MEVILLKFQMSIIDGTLKQSNPKCTLEWYSQITHFFYRDTHNPQIRNRILMSHTSLGNEAPYPSHPKL